MITKNLIVNQLPEYNQVGAKPIRGLVTLNLGAQTVGNIKIFNVDEGILPLCLAIKIGEQKFVFDDISTPQNYDFSLPKADVDSPITLLLAKNSASGVVGVAFATTASGSGYNVEDLFEELPEKELSEIIDREIEKSMEDLQTDTSASCAENDIVTNSENPLNENQTENIDMEQTGNFYSLIQPQLDELFNKFPHFQELENLVANTEWVKVNYAPENSQHYILGKLYDGEIVTHICYGIPAVSRASSPPESLTDYCQWLPLDLNNTDGAGYWVMYQSAETGENVRL